MITLGFDIAIGAVLGLAFLWLAVNGLILLFVGLMPLIERLALAITVARKIRYDVPSPNWFSRLPDGAQLLLAAFGSIGLFFAGCAAVRGVIAALTAGMAAL